jgi:hypothetical protein
MGFSCVGFVLRIMGTDGLTIRSNEEVESGVQ